MKFTIELTSEQLMALNIICTSIVVDNYNELPLLKNEAIQISKSAIMAKKINLSKASECAAITVDQYNQKDDTIFPTEFFDTFNLYVEDNEATSLINDSENLRFIYGKQGQVGIEYWEEYQEDDRADDTMFIKNADIRAIKSEIGKIVLALETNGRNSVINTKYIITDKYQLNTSTDKHCDDARFILHKRNDSGSLNSVVFSNEKQLIIFYRFLEYHLD